MSHIFHQKIRSLRQCSDALPAKPSKILRTVKKNIKRLFFYQFRVTRFRLASASPSAGDKAALVRV